MSESCVFALSIGSSTHLLLLRLSRLLQALLKEGQEELAKILLGCAEHSIGALHDMQAHLTCSHIDLEKISQNLVQKLIDRGLGKRARQQSEQMLVRLAKHRAILTSGQKKSADEASKENRCTANKKAAKEAASMPSTGAVVDWKDALEALTESPDAGRNVPKDESALVLSCLVNLATFALQQPPAGFSPHPVLQICGSGCLRWLQQLAVLDATSSQRLAGSLYRVTTKAAALADAAQGDNAEDVDAALQLRELSLVYLAASGKVGVTEVVAQVVKTAKFYDAKPSVRGTRRMSVFHTRLLDRLSPVLLQMETKDTRELALALSDWAAGYALSQARNFKSPTSTTPMKKGAVGGVRAGAFAQKMEELLLDLGADCEDNLTRGLLAVLSALETMLHLAAVSSSSASSSSSSSDCVSELVEQAKEGVVAVEETLKWATSAGDVALAPLLRLSKVWPNGGSTYAYT